MPLYYYEQKDDEFECGITTFFGEKTDTDTLENLADNIYSILETASPASIAKIKKMLNQTDEQVKKAISLLMERETVAICEQISGTRKSVSVSLRK